MGVIFWFPHVDGSGSGGGTSTDPGVGNVRTGVTYTINSVAKVGTAVLNLYTEAVLTGETTTSTLE